MNNPVVESIVEAILISALDNWGYCPRRAGLIHVEQVFEENLFTLKGKEAHERVHESGVTSALGKRVERSLPVFSDRIGIRGVADLVEFHDDGTIYPVEYKLGGRPRPGHRQPEDLQLCAQALCLEEMFGQPVPRGAIYHFEDRRRRIVEIDAELRSSTLAAIDAVREILNSGALPGPVDDERCPNCSLVDACAPSLWTSALRRGARTLFIPTSSEGLP